MSVWKRAWKIAMSQFGAISRAQLLSCGIGDDAILHRVAAGELIARLPSVYVFAAVPRSHRQDLVCAYLWAGSGSAISHRSAGCEWGLDGVPDNQIEITTPRRLQAQGIKVHRCALARQDIRHRRSMAVTVPERTLVDLAAVLKPLNVEMAMDSAFRLRLTTLDRVACYIAAWGRSGRRGLRVTKHLVEERLIDSGSPHSPAETRLRRLILDSRLSRLVLQHEITDIDGFIGRVDAAYPRLKIAIEAEGWTYHMGKVVWKNDRRRHNRLIAAGWVVLYFTYDDLRERPDMVIEQIEQVVAHRSVTIQI